MRKESEIKKDLEKLERIVPIEPYIGKPWKPDLPKKEFVVYDKVPDLTKDIRSLQDLLDKFPGKKPSDILVMTKWHSTDDEDVLSYKFFTEKTKPNDSYEEDLKRYESDLIRFEADMSIYKKRCEEDELKYKLEMTEYLTKRKALAEELRLCRIEMLQSELENLKNKTE